LVTHAYEAALQILEAHRAQLDVVARALLERETLTAPEFEALLAGAPVINDARVLAFRRRRSPLGPR